MDLFARALVAYTVHEHQLGHATRIDVRLLPGCVVVEDDGRGMGLDRDGYVDGMMGMLVGRADPVQIHGIGLALIAASSPRLVVESRRGGSTWRQGFAWGVAEGPPERVPDGLRAGTRVTLHARDPSATPDLAALLGQVEVWHEANPELTIQVNAAERVRNVEGAGPADVSSSDASAAVRVVELETSWVEDVRAFLVANGWAHRVGEAGRFAELIRNSQRAVVALRGTEVVGFARAITDGSSNGYLSMVVVSAEHRRQGMGKSLVSQTISGSDGITWMLRADRPEAAAFFATLGFEPSGAAMERRRPP